MPNLKRYLVLIIEDDDACALYFKEVLRSKFDVEVVETAEQAMIRLIKPPLIDAILLDLTLPNGKGKELITRFQKAFPTVPKVAITAFSDIKSEDALMAGALRFLNKLGISPEDLTEAIIEVIALQMVRRDFAPVETVLSTMRQSSDEAITRMDAALGKPISDPNKSSSTNIKAGNN